MTSAPEAPEICDRICVACDAVDARLEKQIRTGRNIMHDLQHRPAFVDAENEYATQCGLAIEDRDTCNRKVAGQDIRSGATQGVIAVRYDADGYASAIDTVGSSCHIRT